MSTSSLNAADESTATTSLTVYTSRSLLSMVLQAAVRPIRPRLVRFGKPLPKGSPQLHPPASLKCEVSERLLAGVYHYEILPVTGLARDVTPAKQHLYYFAGGGFQSPPNKEHWKFCTKLAVNLQGLYRVHVVSYPLAPNNPAETSLAILRSWLKEAVEDARGKGQRITLAGDSSGGNVSLSLGLWWAGQLEDVDVKARIVDQVLVISPPTDLRNENPKIHEADRHDAILTKKLTEDVAKTWAGSLSRADPMISPVLGDFDTLKRSGIKIHGVIGLYDVLAPDAVLFRELCEKNHIPGEWLQWERQMHAFPLTAMYGLPEGKKGIDWIVDVLRRNA